MDLSGKKVGEVSLEGRGARYEFLVCIWPDPSALVGSNVTLVVILLGEYQSW